MSKGILVTAKEPVHFGKQIESTSFKRSAYSIVALQPLKWWSQAMNTAVISAAMIYMLLKQ